MPPKKKAKAAAAKKKEKSPCTKYFERLSEAVEQNTEGLGYMLVRGVKRNEDGDEDDEDEDEDDEEDTAAKNDSYTEEQVLHMRHIIINQQGADALEEMQELILGDQAGEGGLMMFDTSFSYEVLDSFDTFFKLLKKKKDPKDKFNYLFAYTHELKSNDVWMHDHECGWGGHKPIAKLAKAWKELLVNDDATLGILDDFSRPGIMEDLQQFKKQVEDIEQYEEPDIKFKFE